jgi:hypothetical protein
VIGDAKRRVVRVKQVENLVVVPARVAELDGAAAAAGQELQEVGEPRQIAPELGRQLEQHRAEMLAQRRHPAEDEVDRGCDVLQLLVVGDEA